MKPWLLALLLKPLFCLAYAGLVAGLYWLATQLPEGRLRRIATYKFRGRALAIASLGVVLGFVGLMLLAALTFD